ncbi:hypothetical protein N8K70_02810 [Microbacterium betulae]|uniref:Uncharacterized protein n=1 Tax=Microbacterium betulae TaxID=2981139 RepID=A0AA97FJ16_9MICO|nr:hypothetical protein [Microbacterium sp. AB]WOF23628.1 hypothetical protein N8K70_02810 [Microbacterium sp. AB]
MYNDDYGWAAGLGIGVVIFGIVLYLAILALVLWIGYLIIRTAVKNGILKADEERAARGYPPRPGGAYPPQQGYSGPPAPGSGPQQGPSST